MAMRKPRSKDVLLSKPAGVAPAPLRTVFETVATRFPGHSMQRIRTPDGRIRYTYASAGMREVFGIDPDAVLAQQEADHRWVHPEDRERFVAALHRSADDLTTLDEEVRVISPRGGYKWVRSIGTPRRFADGTVVWDGIALDVTERRAAAEALERAVALARLAEAERWENERSAFAMTPAAIATLHQAVSALLSTLPPPLAAAPEAEAVRQALASLSPSLAASPGRHAAPRDGGTAALTPRQREVLALLAQGLTNRQIAERLGTAEGTVKLHVAALRRRIGAGNRTAAAVRALQGRV
jgi:PAS domain S-box-containing protein